MLATEQTKDLIQFPENRPYDMILLGRVAIDFNPIDYFKTLAESATFKKYVGGSPANTAVGLARLGRKCGFFAAVSNDRFGDYVTGYFQNEGIDTSHIVRCKNGAAVKEVQVEMGERIAGHSYLTMMKSVQYMVKMAISILLIQWFRKRDTETPYPERSL